MKRKYQPLIILLILLSLITSLFSIYQWRESQRILQINAVLIETLATTRYLAENERKLGTLLKDCLETEACDSQETVTAVNQLRDEKETLTSKFKNLEIEFNQIR